MVGAGGQASGRRPALIASERNQYLDKPSWYWWLKRFVLRHCAAVIANSKAGAVATARRTRLPTSPVRHRRQWRGQHAADHGG